MAWFSNIMVFLIAWWLFFFMMLPIGVRSQLEAGDEIVPGTVESAPSKPNLLKKALAATILAALSVALFDWIVASQIIRFRPSGL